MNITSVTSNHRYERGMTDLEFDAKATRLMPKWPEPYDEIGPLSWDTMGRTKTQMQRSYFFVKKMESFQNKLGNEYPFHELAHGMIVRTEGATLRTIHTPGHSPGRTCLFLNSLFFIYTYIFFLQLNLETKTNVLFF